MNELIIVRHGLYTSEHRLSPEGRLQILALCEKLKTEIAGKVLLILSSTAPRASDSAKIIADCFGVGFEEKEVLWSEHSHPQDFPAALELIRSKAGLAEVLLLVTHSEYANDFPKYFAKNEWQADMQSPIVSTGQACKIDCAKKTIGKI